MTAPGAASAGRPLHGIMLVAVASLAFAGVDVLTKHQAMRHPVPVVAAVRYLVNLALLTVILAPRLGPGLWRTQRSGMVWLRGLTLTFASLSMGYALRLMPVGETVAIVYLAPFVVMLLAIPLLGEKVELSGWIAAAVGFAGVLLIARPGGGLDPLGVMFALMNAGLSTAYHLLSRLLAVTESTAAMLYISALVGAVVFSLLSLGALEGLSIGMFDAFLMVMIGVMSTIGHFLFTAAYREAPASMLAPVNYLHMFWAGGMGFVVFGHLPDAWTIVGMTLVFAAGASVAILAGARNRRR